MSKGNTVFKKERELLRRLDPLTRRLVIACWYILLWHQRFTRLRLRPIHLLVPATLVQIAVFIHASLHPEKFFYIVTVGNLLVVSVAMLPSTLRKKYHWVK